MKSYAERGNHRNLKTALLFSNYYEDHEKWMTLDNFIIWHVTASLRMLIEE